MGACSSASTEKQNNTLILKTMTWNRESHGLFDYENKNIIRSQIQINRPGIIIRQNDDVNLLAEENIQDDNDDIRQLLSLEVSKDGKLFMNSNQISSPLLKFESQDDEKVFSDLNSQGIGDQCIWNVIKSHKKNDCQKGVKLEVGNFLKLGRMRFRVREINIEEKKQDFVEKQNLAEPHQSSQMPSSKKEDSQKLQKFSVDDTSQQQICRICLMETAEPDNPFIAPCHCAGTMKYLHLKCLQEWLKSKVLYKKSDNLTTAQWKNLHCELCKLNWNVTFQDKNKKYDLIDLEKPQTNYLVLEILGKDNNQIKGLHMINANNKNQFYIGRGADSDIRITDISVSRTHASIQKDKFGFYLEDLNSKFGTLILVQGALEIKESLNNTMIQIGRTDINNENLDSSSLN